MNIHPHFGVCFTHNKSQRRPTPVQRRISFSGTGLSCCPSAGGFSIRRGPGLIGQEAKIQRSCSWSSLCQRSIFGFWVANYQGKGVMTMSYVWFWLWSLNLWMVCTMRSASLRIGWAWKENKPKPSYKSAKFSKYEYILRTTNKISVNSDSGINNCHPTRAESHLMWRTSSRRQWQLFHHPWLMVKLREEVLSVVCFAKCLHNACIMFVLCLHLCQWWRMAPFLTLTVSCFHSS